MQRLAFGMGAISAFIGVAAGAFGAHGLKLRVSPDQLAVFETAVRYQLVHALALLAVTWAAARFPGRATTLAALFFILGTVLFSGSLYAMVLTGVRGLGVITPVGGVALLAGWACLAWAALRAPQSSR
jgi:uncharacterized membrane protein YgdD (TMEM256/DUF423 family)